MEALGGVAAWDQQSSGDTPRQFPGSIIMIGESIGGEQCSNLAHLARTGATEKRLVCCSPYHGRLLCGAPYKSVVVSCVVRHGAARHRQGGHTTVRRLGNCRRRDGSLLLRANRQNWPLVPAVTRRPNLHHLHDGQGRSTGFRQLCHSTSLRLPELPWTPVPWSSLIKRTSPECDAYGNITSERVSPGGD